jgi:hypothetical protein
MTSCWGKWGCFRPTDIIAKLIYTHIQQIHRHMNFYFDLKASILCHVLWPLYYSRYGCTFFPILFFPTTKCRYLGHVCIPYVHIAMPHGHVVMAYGHLGMSNGHLGMPYGYLGMPYGH